MEAAKGQCKRLMTVLPRCSRHSRKLLPISRHREQSSNCYLPQLRSPNTGTCWSSNQATVAKCHEICQCLGNNTHQDYGRRTYAFVWMGRPWRLDFSWGDVAHDDSSCHRTSLPASARAVHSSPMFVYKMTEDSFIFRNLGCLVPRPWARPRELQTGITGGS